VKPILVPTARFELAWIQLTFHLFRRQRVYVGMKCLKCKKETKNQKFCSRSCASSFNNASKPKRSYTLINCKLCGEPKRRTMSCDTCKSIREHAKIERSNMSLDDVASLYKQKGIAPSYRHGYVRNHCHVMNHDREKKCQKCGYSIHVELCHVKAISSWPMTATLREINDPSNIVVLCPNHHWELDNGVLHIEDVK